MRKLSELEICNVSGGWQTAAPLIYKFGNDHGRDTGFFSKLGNIIMSWLMPFQPAVELSSHSSK